MAETKARIQKWDILKLILIFLVVFGHVCEQYHGSTGIFFFIYSFHMPLFIFVSGLFSKRTINEKRYDKIFTYLLLYLFIKCISFFSGVINKGTVYFSLFKETGVPWYAFAIFAFCLITVLLRSIKPKYVFIGSIILACLAGYDREIFSFLVSSRIIVFYPFFYAGYALNPNTVNEKLSSKRVKITSAGVIVGYIAILSIFFDEMRFLKPLLSGQNHFFRLEKLAEYGALFRLGYYAVVFLLCAAIISLVPNNIGKGTLAKLGSRSVQVYALHYFFIDLLYKNFGLVEWAEGIFPNFSKILILPISVILLLLCSMKLWEPIFNFILNPDNLRQSIRRN